jgi:cytidylate kinase
MEDRRMSGSGNTDAPDAWGGSAASGDGDSPVLVAIDGPAGSGKSSVSRAAARSLGYGYLDTGASYRALSWHLLDRGIDASVAMAVVDELPHFDFGIGTDPGDYYVRVGSTDVTEAIREPRVTGVVSLVARIPAVRVWLNERFRAIVATTAFAGVVVEGRDITTVVAPDAPVRILLTASEEARAARRSKELTSESAADVGAALRSRDQADSRVVDFMNAAEGVITVDSTELDFEQTVERVVEVVRSRVAPIHP